MARILVTGMSGAGKSTLLAELAGRGWRVVDTDNDGWTLADGRWDEPRMTRLLTEHSDVVVSGTTDNQGRFYHLFDVGAQRDKHKGGLGTLIQKLLQKLGGGGVERIGIEERGIVLKF